MFYRISSQKEIILLSGYTHLREATQNYIEGCQKKIKLPERKTFIKAIMAGAMIAFGAAISSVAAHNITDVGIARLAAAVVFPVGLMMVILFNAELFTGDCLVAMSIFDRKIRIVSCVRLLATAYIGNFIGAIMIAALILFCGQLDYSSGLLGAYTIKIAVSKVNLSFVEAFTSGILCNILVCAAVLMAACAKDVTGKLLVCFFVIMLFVTGGFEHCVANMYYITAGLFAMTKPEYVKVAMDTYSFSADYLSTLNIGSFFLKNLLPVTLGNIIGGSVLVGIPVFYLNKDRKKS